MSCLRAQVMTWLSWHRPVRGPCGRGRVRRTRRDRRRTSARLPSRPPIEVDERRTFVGREFGGILALGGSSLRGERKAPPRYPCHAAERQVSGSQEEAGRFVHANRAAEGQHRLPPPNKGRGRPVSVGAARTTIGNIRHATP